MKIGKWKLTVKDAVWFIVCLGLVLCFCIGLLVFKEENALSILSGASTAVSIVLSIVAILYTMMEGADSARINQDSQNKLDDIETQLREVNKRLLKVRELDKRIKYVTPKLEMAVQEMERSDNKSLNDNLKKEIQDLMSYIEEDIDS